MLDNLQPAVSRRRERRSKTPKPIAKSDSIIGSSTDTGLIEYVNSSVVTETLKSPSELRKHLAVEFPQKQSVIEETSSGFNSA
jgi:hypothetical protein